MKSPAILRLYNWPEAHYSSVVEINECCDSVTLQNVNQKFQGFWRTSFMDFGTKKLCNSNIIEG